MSRGGGKSAGGRRTVAPDEAELWSQVARSVDKVRSKPRVPSHVDAVEPTPAASARAASAPAKTRASAAGSRPAPPPPRQKRPGRHPLPTSIAALSARSRPARSRSTRASICMACASAMPAPSCTRSSAPRRRAVSRPFWSSPARATLRAERDHLAGALGKPQRGVLRHSVPQWLGEPELRPVVLSYTSAGTRHGGDGALYVQLRKSRQGRVVEVHIAMLVPSGGRCFADRRAHDRPCSGAELRRHLGCNRRR